MRSGVGRRLLAVVLLAAAGSAQVDADLQVEVVDETGAPLPGVTVATLAAGGPLAPMGTTDAAGRCSLQFAGDQPIEVHVTAPGRSGATIPAASLIHGGLATRCVVLARGVTLFGRVRDPSDQPIAGAVVCAVPLRVRREVQMDWRTECRATSDGDGIFKLQGVPDNNVRLTIDAEGHFGMSLAPVVLGTPLEVELEPSEPIRGRVIDAAGAPVEAEVEVEYEGDAARQLGHTGADGRFALTWRRPTFCRVYARTGSPPAAIAHSAVIERPGADLQLSLRPLRDLPMLRVRATGDGGAPLANFRAMAVWQLGAGPAEALWPTFAADSRAASDGICLLPPPGLLDNSSTTLLVQAPGRATVTTEVLWSAGADGSCTVTIATEPECTLRGTVVDADGAPVAGARVWGRRESNRQRGILASKPGGDAVTTAADGTFVLGGLASGRTYVHCALGRQRARTVRVDVEATGENAPVRLQLAANLAVRGQVTPIAPGWRLGFALPPDHEVVVAFMPWAVSCDLAADAPLAATGTFACTGLRPGTLLPTLSVPRPPHRGGWLRVFLPRIRLETPQDDPRSFDVSLTGPGTVHGAVTITGAPMPPERLAIEIRIAGPDAALPFMAESGWTALSAVGRDGSFAFAAAPGRYLVRAVDVLSGIELARSEQPVVVSGGEVGDCALAVVAAEVKLDLVDVDANDFGPATSLRRHSEGEAQALAFDGAERQVHLLDKLTSDVLYLPPGPCQLKVSCLRLPEPQPFPRSFAAPEDQGVEVGGVDVDADPDQPAQVRIEVPRRRLRR